MGQCFLCQEPTEMQCPDCCIAWSCPQHLPIHRPASTCLPFSVGFVEGKGRVVLAIRDIEAGEVVLTDLPLAAGPGNRSPPTCLECLKDWDGENRCPECGWPVCSQECANGKHHQLECGYLAKCPPDGRPDFKKQLMEGRAPEYAAIFPLRIATLAKSDPAAADKLSRLMDHRSDIEREDGFPDLWKRPVLDFLTMTFDSGFTVDQLIRGVGIFCTNAVSMPHRNGRWLFPTFSFLSHSCISNSRFFLHPGDTVVVRAQVNIRSGEEVTVSYVEPGQGRVLRHPYIQRMWHFSCTCPLCSDPTELGTFLSAIRCRECKTGHLLPMSCVEPELRWSCSVCPSSTDTRTMEILAKTLEAQVKGATTLAEVESLLSALSKVLHPSHFLLLALKEKWVKLGAEGRTSLELALQYLSEIMKVRRLIEPGLTLTLGQNLTALNRVILGLAKIRLEEGEISKEEFFKVAAGVAANVKMAKKCFEDSKI